MPEDSNSPPPPDAAEVRTELERILASPAFRGSRRCQDFLTFVVGQVLDGDPDSLKERTLAVRIFGRSADANLNEDSIVRVGAREVRKRLAQYYSVDGAADPIRIELPPGTYVPAFRPLRLAPVAPIAEPAAPLPQPPRDPEPAIAPIARRVPAWTAASSLILLASLALLAWMWFRQSATPFDVFWAPVLEARAVTVALPSADARSSYQLGARLSGRPVRLLTGGVAEPLASDSVAVLGGDAAALLMARLRYRYSAEADNGILDSLDPSRRWPAAGAAVIARVPHPETGGFVLVVSGDAELATDPALLNPLLARLPPGWSSRNLEMVARRPSPGAPPELVASHIW
ncbi:MAG: hypothetical protein JSU00_03070 [Acidobacteria bacterium]|nr:hypothetical protein [Acidobacteriota bacterium]